MTEHPSETQKRISKFLEEDPLYKKIEIPENFIASTGHFNNIKFDYYCNKCEKSRGFMLYPHSYVGMPLETMNKWLPIMFISDNIQYYHSWHYRGKCPICGIYELDFLFAFYYTNVKNESDKVEKKYYLMKIGQYPPYKISIDKNLKGFLNEEDQDNYQKALICLSQSYGIGAFAYLRRILENELIRIINKLADLDLQEKEKITGLIKQYEKDHIMQNLIDGIYEYLPASLKTLGANPFNILYKQLSGGIHEFSEDVCINKSKKIDNILKYVLKELALQKFEIPSVKDDIKNLSK